MHTCMIKMHSCHLLNLLAQNQHLSALLHRGSYVFESAYIFLLSSCSFLFLFFVLCAQKTAVGDVKGFAVSSVPTIDFS